MSPHRPRATPRLLDAADFALLALADCLSNRFSLLTDLDDEGESDLDTMSHPTPESFPRDDSPSISPVISLSSLSSLPTDSSRGPQPRASAAAESTHFAPPIPVTPDSLLKQNKLVVYSEIEYKGIKHRVNLRHDTGAEVSFLSVSKASSIGLSVLPSTRRIRLGDGTVIASSGRTEPVLFSSNGFSIDQYSFELVPSDREDGYIGLDLLCACGMTPTNLPVAYPSQMLAERARSEAEAVFSLYERQSHVEDIPIDGEDARARQRALAMIEAAMQRNVQRCEQLGAPAINFPGAEVVIEHSPGTGRASLPSAIPFQTCR